MAAGMSWGRRKIRGRKMEKTHKGAHGASWELQINARRKTRPNPCAPAMNKSVTFLPLFGGYPHVHGEWVTMLRVSVRECMSAKGRAKRDKRRKRTERGARNHGNFDSAVWDKRLKFVYFIPHVPQDLREASPYWLYTPGLLSSAPMLNFVATLPADIRESHTDPSTVLRFRLRRLLWRNVIPIELDALHRVAVTDVFGSMFRVVFTNDEDMAREIDGLAFADGLPFLHVSSIPGESHVRPEDLPAGCLDEFVGRVLERLQEQTKWRRFVSAVRQMLKVKRREVEELPFPRSHHNLNMPNEVALESFGWKLVNDDPLVPVGSTPPARERYIERHCEGVHVVLKARAALLMGCQTSVDYAFLLTVPSVHWAIYRHGDFAWNDAEKGAQRALRAVFKLATRQETYFDTLSEDQEIMRHGAFRALMAARRAEYQCYTAALSILSSNTMVPVIRLEPKINNLRGQFKLLGQCARSKSQDRKQFKQSRLLRVAAERMRALIDASFLPFLDVFLKERRIQGMRLVADLPLEVLRCGGIALALRYDVSRIPVTPGNLFLMNCVSPPLFVNVNRLFDILVVRSFEADDPLALLLEKSIGSVMGGIKEPRPKACFVDVTTVDELVSALNRFTGAILIFDGHGDYESELGVGTVVIGGRSIDLWDIRKRCRVPPIVIFSACDTHPIDGSHSSAANAAFVLGARCVLATSLPIRGDLASIFIARLVLRIGEFVPIAVKIRQMLTWREVVSGLQRMTYVSEVTELLAVYAGIRLSDKSREAVQLAANVAINDRQADWFETYLRVLAKESGCSQERLLELIDRWASFTDALKYVQLGSPENVVITS